jgi:hypothetical protein
MMILYIPNSLETMARIRPIDNEADMGQKLFSTSMRAPG